MKGSTGICIFSGILKAPLYVQILEQTLLPFLRDVFPNEHRFMQDNDPKHTSRIGKKFLEDNGIHWWKLNHLAYIICNLCICRNPSHQRADPFPVQCLSKMCILSKVC